MERSGFRGIKTEWWHYTLKNEPYPNTYFTFPVSDLLFLPDKEKATPSAAGDPKPDTVAPADPSKAKPEEAESAQPAEKPAP